MSKIHTANLAYGFPWECHGNMPDISILDLFPEDELEEYLDFDLKTFEIDMNSYQFMGFDDFLRLINNAFKILSTKAGYDSSPLAVYPVGEDDFGLYYRVCIVLESTLTNASFNNAVSVDSLVVPETKDFLDMVISRYFPKSEPGWLIWPYSTV